MLKVLLLVLVVVGFAAQSHGQPHIPARGVTPMSSVDSARFEKAFDALYPIVKPNPSVLEMTDRYLRRALRNGTSRGIDSAAAYHTVMQNLDTNMDREMIENAYRQYLSADDLQALLAFARTPSGERYLAAEPVIVRTRTDFVERTLLTYLKAALGPILGGKERPGQSPLPPGAEPGGPMHLAPPKSAPPAESHSH